MTSHLSKNTPTLSTEPQGLEPRLDSRRDVTKEHALVIERLSFEYSDQCFEFTLEVDQGDTLALIGPSGAGKSTLLHMIAGLTPPSAGQLAFDGKSLISLAPYQRPISMLFQDNNLFSHLTVEQNIGLAVNPSLKLTEAEKQVVRQVASDVGLAGKLNQMPLALSGGQRQRVALARCCAQRKPLWLLDEPFSALDPELRLEMLSLVKQLANQHNLTVIMVTHQVSDALRIADSFGYVEQGNLCYSGSIEQLKQLKESSTMRSTQSLERFLASSS
ncbi:thiamine ABC transporter ATP-binding protein [Vibrio ulleungensis]|uniref:Thiamine ABC transporter ATP-binding protein n=1 Tax=Vibrio ulleungensis TaxID=2807619 RepID=A0ABS2HL93_9VIBR|nr:thiamine ABC transporter ATP-binding protein [Vibrio ulleungensis]MBM7037342.1 thiamine ABC transporter ATP-binding protein [Vibrio ulleungensis]